MLGQFLPVIDEILESDKPARLTIPDECGGVRHEVAGPRHHLQRRSVDAAVGVRAPGAYCSWCPTSSGLRSTSSSPAS